MKHQRVSALVRAQRLDRALRLQLDATVWLDPSSGGTRAYLVPSVEKYEALRRGLLATRPSRGSTAQVRAVGAARKFFIPGHSVAALDRAQLASRIVHLQQMEAALALAGREARRLADRLAVARLRDSAREVRQQVAQWRRALDSPKDVLKENPDGFVQHAGDQLHWQRTLARMPVLNKDQDLAYLARVVLWAAGPDALDKFLICCQWVLHSPDAESENASIWRLYRELRRIRTRVSQGAYDALRTQQALLRVTAGLPRRLRDGGLVAPSRAKESIGQLCRLMKMCRERLTTSRFLGRYKRLVALAAFYGASESRLQLPEPFVRAMGAKPAWRIAWVMRRLDRQADGPGFEKLLNSLVPTSPDDHFPDVMILSNLLDSGASVEDVRWARSHDVQHAFYDLAQAIGPIHAWCNALADRSVVLLPEAIRALARQCDSKRFLEVIRHATRWIERVPAEIPRDDLVRQLTYLTNRLPQLLGVLAANVGAVGAWARPPRAACRRGAVPANAPPLLREVAFYRRLSREADPLPSALRKRLFQHEREARERQYLASQTGTNGASSRALRLCLLESRSDAGHTQKADAQLRRAAARSWFHESCRAMVSLPENRALDWLGEHVSATPTTASPKEQLELALWALRLERGDRELLVTILEHWHEHGAEYRRQLPFNRTWLNERSSALAFLVPPADARLTIACQEYLIRAGRDPLDVMLMGSRLGTCLGLCEGLHADSVLGNASDANKQVVYLLTPTGQYRARMLFGVTDAETLLRFDLYTTGAVLTPAAREAIDAEFSEWAARWAARAGLRLADEGTVSPLGYKDWYDDGPAGWPKSAQDAWAAESAPPTGKSSAGEAVLENESRQGPSTSVTPEGAFPLPITLAAGLVC